MYVQMDPTAHKPPGTGAVQKYWNRGLPLIASGHCISFHPVSVPRGRCVGVLGLRFALFQDVAASFGLTVAAAAVRLEFDVAASLMSAVAAATVTDKTIDRIFDVCVLFPGAFSIAGNDETENGADLRDKSERLERREVEVLSLAWEAEAPVGERHHPCHRLSKFRPRASRSSSHRDERWEGCRV